MKSQKILSQYFEPKTRSHAHSSPEETVKHRLKTRHLQEPHVSFSSQDECGCPCLEKQNLWKT